MTKVDTMSCRNLDKNMINLTFYLVCSLFKNT